MAAPPAQLPANPDLGKRTAPEQLTGPRTEQALVPLTDAMPTIEPLVLTRAQASLPVQVDVSIPVREFRVCNLLALECAHLVESSWDHEADVPLAAGEVQLAWSEFEVVDTQLAVRVTRLV